MDPVRAPHAAGLPRRSLIRGAFWALGAAALGAFVSLTDRFDRFSGRARDVSIPAAGDAGITFVDGIVVCRENQRVRVFAATCTHLGCRLSHAVDGLIVCPCHGSKFRSDGSVAAGPASRPLEPLTYRTDPRTGVLVVHVV